MGLKYRCISPNVNVFEMPVAANQKFSHNGANFVCVDSNGNIRLALTADTLLYGFALEPEGMGAGTDPTYWQSSSTDGKDRILIVRDDDAQYLVPANGTIAQSNVGVGYDLIGVNDGSQQVMDTGNSNNKVLIPVKPGTALEDGSSTDAVVIINPIKYQVR